MHPFNAFGSETANERTVQCWLLRSAVAGCWKLTMTNWQWPSNWILLQLHEKLPKNSKPTVLQLSGIWTKLERWKSSITGCPLDWLEENPKTIVLKYWLLLLYATTMNHFLITLWHVRKSGLYTTTVTTGWVVGPSSSSQALPKVKPASQKGHAHCLVVCCGSDPLQLSESKWNHYVWEICSANWPDALKTAKPAASIGQQKGPSSSAMTSPDCMLHNQCFKSWINWATKFCLIHHIHWPFSNQIPLLQAFQLFAGKMLLQPAGGRKSSLSVCQFLKHRFLSYRNDQTYFSLANVLIVMVPIVINKDVVEPSYNDFRFTVWNHSYIGTSVITSKSQMQCVE